MAYEGKCGSCENFEEPRKNEHYSPDNAYYVKGYCSWYKTYFYPDNSCREHYRKLGDSSGGCYITTMVHGILGMDDKSDTMETVRSLRDNVMQKDIKYKETLYEYDFLGPKIAENLKYEDKKIVKKLYNDYLIPIVKLIKEGKVEDAIKKYRFMTYVLACMYGIDDQVKVPEEYDHTTGGHGKLTIKKK